MDPRVLDALAIAGMVAFPEAGAATWVVRFYLRMQVLQLIAAEGAAREVKQDLPRALTPPAVQQRSRTRQPRVPTVKEMHKQVQQMACDGVEHSLRRAGHSVTRNGNRLTVRESS